MMEKNRGFTLLELAVTLLLVAILYGVLSTRLNKVAESAERAAVYGMLGQLQSQISLRTAQFYIAGTTRKLALMAEENPFDWLPANAQHYGGELDGKESKTPESGLWYFDTEARQLVYRARKHKFLKIQGENGEELRFVLKLNGKAADNRQRTSVYSISIQAVTPFMWEIESSP